MKPSPVGFARAVARALIAAILCVGSGFAAVPDDHPAKLILEGVPPSPSTAPGKRLWQPPRFTHWPGIVYNDEVRNVAIQFPMKTPGVEGSFQWQGQEALSFSLPAEPERDRISGIVPLPQTQQQHQAAVQLGTETHQLALSVVPIDQPWPHDRLVEGFPVDANGVPVVLQTQRRDGDRERRWAALRPNLPLATGRSLLVGDDMRALGSSFFDLLKLDTRAVSDARNPHYATLVALADLPDPLPQAIIWSPGNASLFSRSWSGEEVRILEVLVSRFEQAQAVPRLVLCLPPIPLDEHLVAEAKERRALLRRVASTLNWFIVDVEQVAGSALEANKVTDAAFTRYPLLPAQKKIAQALTDLLNSLN